MHDPFVVELFSHPSGNEGQMFVSKKAMGTNSNGPFSFIPSQAVTAAATDSVDGDISVFLGPRTVTQQQIRIQLV